MKKRLCMMILTICCMLLVVWGTENQQDDFVLGYPSGDDVMGWIHNGAGRADEAWCHQELVDMTARRGQIELNGVFEREIGPYIRSKTYITSIWRYDMDRAAWRFAGCKENTDVKLKGIDGEYPANQGGSIVIRNGSGNGFELCDTSFGTNTVRMTYCYTSDDGETVYYSGTGMSYFVDGTQVAGTDADVSVWFTGGEDAFHINVAIMSADMDFSITDCAQMTS